MPRVLLPLAAGFEEIEAVTIIDVLRRAGIDVVVAGLDGAGRVDGAHGIAVEAPVGLDAHLDDSFDMIVLPGGEPGTTHLAADGRLARLLLRHSAAGRPLGAICAAPRVLAAQGLLAGRTATSHPSVETHLREAGVRYDGARVVRDGAVLTSRGPGTSLEFALGLLEMLGEGTRAAELRRSMLVHQASAVG
jgi:4-methyl-5(b-hydroxyethyl)-thiazole monophosphate biosynthesis